MNKVKISINSKGTFEFKKYMDTWTDFISNMKLGIDLLYSLLGTPSFIKVNPNLLMNFRNP